MKQQVYLGFFLIVVLLAGCKAGRKAYNRGDYKDAVIQSIERLRVSPNNENAAEILTSAYPSMIEYYEDKIMTAKLGSEQLRWEMILRDYQALNQVYDQIQRSPAAKTLLSDARRYTIEEDEAKTRAADVRYALGSKELSKGNRENAKMAYDHFAKALSLVPDFRDAEELMQQAREDATVFVQIESMPVASRAFQLSYDFFEKQVFEYVRQTDFGPFVQFLFPMDPRAARIDPDQKILLAFDDFVVGQAFERERIADRVKDSVVLRTERRADTTINVYGTVRARVIGREKEITSSGLLDASIVDLNSGQVLGRQKFPGTFVWYDYWGYFEGDERALTEEDKKYIRKRSPAPDPYPQDLFIEFTRPIYGQLTRYIRDMYRGY